VRDVEGERRVFLRYPFTNNKSKQIHVQTFKQYGALEYGLALTRQLSAITHLSHDSNTTQGERRAESLKNFEKIIQKEIDVQIDRQLVLATAIKDTKSSLHILGVDMLCLIGQCLRQPAILRWEDVMREHIQDTQEKM
jgi:transcriptional regulator with PAS, ATPase and Fis domain